MSSLTMFKMEIIKAVEIARLLMHNHKITSTAIFKQVNKNGDVIRQKL